MSFDEIYDSEAWYYSLRPSEELEEYLSRRVVTGGQALDLGCGEGRDSILLAGVGYSVTAVDLSEVGIVKLNAYAVRHSLDISGTCGDATALYLEPHSYDAICAVTVLDHISREAAQPLASAMRLALRPGGFLFVEVFTTEDPGAAGQSGVSETAEFVRHYFRHGELRGMFAGLHEHMYVEKTEIDESHGPAHIHGVAILIAEAAV